MHAWDRQHRASVGDSLGESSALEKRLLLRFRDPWMPRSMLGAWQGPTALKTREVAVRVDVGPHSPLLKRVIRRPYRLETERGRRALHRDAVPWAEIHREDKPRASSMLFSARARVAFDNPLRGDENRPEVDLHQRAVVGWLRARRIQVAGTVVGVETGEAKT